MSEKAALGDWLAIGYEAPGTKTNASNYSDNLFQYTGTESTWQAKALQGLNDCKINDAWKLKSSVTTTNALKIQDDGTTTDCKALTASWDNLMRN